MVRYMCMLAGQVLFDTTVSLHCCSRVACSTWMDIVLVLITTICTVDWGDNNGPEGWEWVKTYLEIFQQICEILKQNCSVKDVIKITVFFLYLSHSLLLIISIKLEWRTNLLLCSLCGTISLSVTQCHPLDFLFLIHFFIINECWIFF